MAKILSGQVSLTPGVAVAGANTGNINSGFYVFFPASNTSTYCWIGNNAKTSSSDVSSSDLFRLAEDKTLFFDGKRVENFNELWVMGATDASTDGSDVVCWITG